MDRKKFLETLGSTAVGAVLPKGESASVEDKSSDKYEKVLEITKQETINEYISFIELTVLLEQETEDGAKKRLENVISHIESMTSDNFEDLLMFKRSYRDMTNALSSLPENRRKMEQLTGKRIVNVDTR